ncbi:Autoinducer binding domain-containing protein, partial [Faunimonas pinastri]
MSSISAGPLGLSRSVPGSAIADLFRRLDSCEREEEAQSLAGDIVQSLGFAYFSYGVPWLAADWGRPNDTGMLLTTYPEGWQNWYRKRSYHAEDAVILRGRNALRPFNWGDEDHLSSIEPSSRGLFFEAQEFGIGSGIAIPVHGPGNMSDVPPGIRTVLSWNFPLMIPGSGRGEFHEDVE